MRRPPAWMLAAVLLLAIGGAVYLRSRANTDVRQIRKALQELVELAQLEAREDVLHAGVRARAIGGAFADDISATTPVFRHRIHDRSSLEALVLQARTHLDSISISIHDLEVEVAADGRAATATLSANARVVGAGTSAEEWRDVELEWRKEEGEWLISAADTIETIQQPLGR